MATRPGVQNLLNSSNFVLAAMRRAKKPAAGPPPVASITPPRATFTPGALDQAGAIAKGNLDYGYQTGSRGIEQSYTDTKAELDAARPKLDQQRDTNYIQSDSGTAGRGFGRSGLRVLGRTKVGEAYDEGVRDLGLRAQRAATARQQGLDQLEGDYRTNSTNNLIDSNVRQKTAFDEANPVTEVPPVVAATAPKPKVSYKAWLNGRTSTPLTAAAWRKAQGI